ncbi:MAG: hypothetical protein K0U29_02110 [Gammaproteobacteria bacterium]|nr:hypothetical protein [Gammaproteobacteria bacterium]MCH9743704.1 hypothetical protein [Gammaproteobacteria bacterium]
MPKEVQPVVDTWTHYYTVKGLQMQPTDDEKKGLKADQPFDYMYREQLVRAKKSSPKSIRVSVSGLHMSTEDFAACGPSGKLKDPVIEYVQLGKNTNDKKWQILCKHEFKKGTNLSVTTQSVQQDGKGMLTHCTLSFDILPDDMTLGNPILKGNKFTQGKD